jgi:hypothetical protein
MARQWENNSSSTLASAINTTDTTITVATGEGSLFPVAGSGDTFALTLQDASSNIEVVLATAHTSGADTFTITRAQEGTTARNWAIGDVVELRLTAAAITEFATKAGTETLSNKTLASPAVTGTLTLGGTAVTSTAAELNILDGVTSTAAELNILDGVTATAAEINLVDGASAGNVVANKVVCADSNSKVPVGATWKIYEAAGELYFEISGSAKAKLDGTGTLTLIGTVVQNGTL